MGAIEQKLEEAELLCEQSKYDEARQIVNRLVYHDSATFNVESDISPEQLAHCYRLFGVIEYRVQNYDKASEWLHKAEDLSRSVNDHSGIAKAYGNLGSIYIERSEFSTALEVLMKGLEIQEELGDIRAQSILLANISVVYRRRTMHAKALEFAQRALAIDEKIGNARSIASTLVSLGNVQYTMGDNHGALLTFKRSLALCEEHGLVHGIAINNNSLGVLLRRIGDTEAALEHFRKSLAAHDESNNKVGLASVFNNIGLTYQQIADYDHALQYYHRALEISEDLRSIDTTVSVLSNIGAIYLFQNKASQAEEQFRRSLSLAEEIDFTEGIIMSKANLGKVQLEYGHCREARDILEEMMVECVRAGVANHEPAFLDTLGEIYLHPEFEERDPIKACDYIRRSITLREDSGLVSIDAYSNLSEALEQAGMYKEALEAHREYLRRKEKAQSDHLLQQTQLFDFRQRTERAEREQQLAKTKHSLTMNLLHKTLPPSVAERLMKGEQNIADRYENVSILFADIVGFTPLSARTEPRIMVRMLNTLFTRFDRQTQIHGVERIKTIGDAYMCIAGAPEPCSDHAVRILKCAQALRNEAALFSQECGELIQLRIGVHCGEVVAAVVGETKFSYDVWSDAVNLAARMESHGEADRIHCTQDFVDELERYQIQMRLHSRDLVDVKGKGFMQTYFVDVLSPVD